MTAEREAMTLEQVRGEMQKFIRTTHYMTKLACDYDVAAWRDAIDAHLSRAAEPVAFASYADLETLKGLSEGRFNVLPIWRQRGDGIADTALYTHPPEPARDANNKPWTDGEKAHFQAAAELILEREQIAKNAARWRKARQLISATEIEEATAEVASGGRHIDEEYNVLTDAAIDAAMAQESGE